MKLMNKKTLAILALLSVVSYNLVAQGAVVDSEKQKAEMQALVVEVGMAVLTADDNTFEYRTTKVPAAIAALEKHRAILDDATYNKTKSLLEASKNADAVDVLDEALSKYGE